MSSTCESSLSMLFSSFLTILQNMVSAFTRPWSVQNTAHYRSPSLMVTCQIPLQVKCSHDESKKYDVPLLGAVRPSDRPPSGPEHRHHLEGFQGVDERPRDTAYRPRSRYVIEAFFSTVYSFAKRHHWRETARTAAKIRTNPSTHSGKSVKWLDRLAPNLAHMCRFIWEWIYSKQIAL